MKESCEGCRAYYYNATLDGYYCSHGIKSNFLYKLTLTVQFCPCVNCLIKPMCTKVCEDFINYRAMFNRNKRY